MYLDVSRAAPVLRRSFVIGLVSLVTVVLDSDGRSPAGLIDHQSEDRLVDGEVSSVSSRRLRQGDHVAASVRHGRECALDHQPEVTELVARQIVDIGRHELINRHAVGRKNILNLQAQSVK